MKLRLRGGTLHLGSAPLLMGVLNATPDSFSDARGGASLDERVARAGELLDAGADLLDIGGESNVTNRPAVSVEEEIERVVPLIERVVAQFGAVVSVDTYKPEVAEAALGAGARMVNDISGLADDRLAALCASTGAGLVIMHTPVAPKTQLHDPVFYGDVAVDVAAWLAARMAHARALGVAPEQIVLDPGPDFGKTPAQTVAVLRGLPLLHALGRPLLLAISRKDFIGAALGRGPRERLAGTLAALAFGADQGGQIFRVHDVRECADFLAVRALLRGERMLEDEVRVPEHLRREPVRE